MRALIHFHAGGGDYQPQAFLPRSACQPSLPPLVHSSSLILSFAILVRSVLPLFDHRISVSLFSAFAALLNRCSILGGYSGNVVWMQYKGFCRRRRRRSCDCLNCVFAFTCTHMPNVHVEPREDRRGEGDCSVDVYLYRDCSHALP